MPTNIYGPGDNFDEKTSHVLPALIGKLHAAMKAGSKSVTVWGSGTPKREFMYSEDLASACIFLLENYNDDSHINVGTGTDLSISELAQTIAKVVGFEGEIQFDTSKPDGTPRKLLDVTRINSLGWSSSMPLNQGIELTYRWYLENVDKPL
jgi:GDP-L-fucose synthase